MAALPVRNRTKRLLIFRAFALANGAFVALGVGRLAPAIFQAFQEFPVRYDLTYAREMFFVFAVCNLILLAALAITAVRLWRMAHAAVLHSTWVYAGVVIYNLAIGLLWALPDPWGSSVGIAAVAGGNLGLRALHWTGYPVIAALALNVARHHTRMHSETKEHAAQRRTRARSAGSGD
jgi:hypothetical protein